MDMISGRDMYAVLDSFHPAIKKWFSENVGTPSLPQALGWPEIQTGKNVLISAPTGSGKTLAAFLESIDRLLKMSLEGALPDGVFILYISPLKSLNNDIYKNLDMPLEGIRRVCQAEGIPFPEIRKAVRTGDTPQNERHRMLKHPPHILITTPESLYLMLTSRKPAEHLKNIRYLVVDEIHTMLGTKRGVHLALSVERLEHLTEHELVRIGLSATVNPIESAAAYLGGMKNRDGSLVKRAVSIIAPQMERSKDLQIHMPVADFRVLEQGTIWPEIYDSVLKLIRQHHTTIVFVNNRAVAEKVAANINALAGEEICRPHHGSISRTRRLEVEDMFKNGELRCMIATSTLELGIDIGAVDLMVQVAAPISVSSGLQRLGRAGHSLNATSKGVIVPKTRGDLLKSAFIAGEMLTGHIEREKIPENCLDILAQHIVSMCCERTWTEEEMLNVVRCTWSYRDLKESDFKRVLAMLAGDFEHMEDLPAKPRIYWDRQSHTLEGTGYSRMLAVSSSGTIPDRGYFTAVLEDYKTRIGELDEVFVFEARLGDRFFLGNSAWKIVKIEKNRVIVAPGSATGAKTPFWQGDGIGCPYEQGTSFGRFLREISEKLDSEDFTDYAASSRMPDGTAALNIKNYLKDQREALGCISNDRLVIVEYLKDDVSDQRIVVHAHFGGKVNSVLAILLQKALEDTIGCQVFSSHSDDAVLLHIYGCPDPISNLFSLLSPQKVERVLLEMLPSTSRFAMTFRYNAYRSLMMGVRNLGQRLPLWIQRLRSVDALENARKHMDHPLLLETMRECLEEIFDIPDTVRALQDIQSGRIDVVEKNNWFPSPFASELLFEFKAEMMYLEKVPHPGDTKKPVVSGVEALNLTWHRDTAAEPVNPEAVRDVAVKNSAPTKLAEIHSVNELHSFLLIYGDTSRDEIPVGRLREWSDQLLSEGRALRINISRACKEPGKGLYKKPADGPDAGPGLAQDVGSDIGSGTDLYIAVEEKELYTCAFGLDPSSQPSETWTQEDALLRILRRFSRYHSPFSPETLEERYALGQRKLRNLLNRLQADGLLNTGSFTGPGREEFCHTRVYESIIRRDSSMKANEVAVQEPAVFSSFLYRWQTSGSGPADADTALYAAVRQLEGLYLPLYSWENIVFPARLRNYSPIMLDKLCASGRVFWRILPGEPEKGIQLAWYCMENTAPDSGAFPVADIPQDSPEGQMMEILRQRGACFTHILSALSGRKTGELLDILERLVCRGWVVNDSFTAVRYLADKNLPGSKNPDKAPAIRARKIALAVSRSELGRWEIAWPVQARDLKTTIHSWFRRYGLLSKDVLDAENTGISWSDLYNALKQMEYAGEILRGYFIRGISGIQFMLPDAYRCLHETTGMYVLNACDPAQPYGKLIPHTENLLPFTSLPGTAVIMDSGNPAVLFERNGEKITFKENFDKLNEAIQLFTEAFSKKQIWPDRKKVAVKYWPENEAQRDRLQKALYDAGFRNEVMKMVFWR